MVIKRDVWFHPAGKTRTLHIYLPEHYGESEERYPVMYFFDGHNLFYDGDATYGKCWGLKDFMDRWDKPMIIVGVECGHEGDERLGEYCPYSVNRGFLRKVKGIGADTVQWMIRELKPMIDREYRTYPFRECTGIAGSSMGGLMAVYAVICYNRWFSKAACLSSAVSPCMSYINRDLKSHFINPDTRVYLSWGTKEAWGVRDHNHEDVASYTSRCNHSIGKQLSDRGAAVQIYCQVGGAHCEADWEKQVPGFMDFLWKARNL